MLRLRGDLEEIWTRLMEPFAARGEGDDFLPPQRAGDAGLAAAVVGRGGGLDGGAGRGD